MNEVEKASIKRLERELDEAMAAKDKVKVKAVMKQLEDAEKLEAKELKAKADAAFEATSAARTELTLQVQKAIGEAVGKFRSEIVKLVGEDEALLRFSIDYKAGNLVTCSIVRTKPRAVGNGGGYQGGKTRDEYGKSLGEIFEAFATDKDRTDLASATSNSMQWQVKVRVKKAAIAAGTLKPAS